ncbi:AraC family transcriptional regulator [Rhizobium sp. EC-SD404]|uniref:AraC family transcriptional regulator n=1 Tax=Rhizobium sp. EC-SD404 TaxID=2038389 RepID=UPI00125B04ED|nr:AraC family transcriptional regulator [Rhizobium sp. EC-SD404]VVT23328.1 Helix-turn-helix domain protein [Rhizobium sp. EC-SD404]
MENLLLLLKQEMDRKSRTFYIRKSASIQRKSEIVTIPTTDPLASVVTLLRPQPSISKRVTGGGRWHVERTNMASPFYCAIVEGTCRLTIEDRAPLLLEAGDFVLVPEVFDFTLSSIDPPPKDAPRTPLETGPGTFRLGDPEAPTELKCLVGHCRFASPDKALIVSLLPAVIHVRAQARLIALVQMINEETRSDRPARDMVLERLLELLLVEALRSVTSTMADPGLLRGLADPRLALALRRIHADPAARLSVQGLATAAGMSRTTFFDRFRNEVGSAPMEYVAAWRMALAKNMLLTGNIALTDLARHVGYGSVSAFSTAFSRHVGTPPGAFAAQG